MPRLLTYLLQRVRIRQQLDRPVAIWSAAGPAERGCAEVVQSAEGRPRQFLQRYPSPYLLLVAVRAPRRLHRAPSQSRTLS